MNLYWWRRPVHVSWSLAVVALGIIVGVIVMPHIPGDWGMVVWLLLGVSLAVFGLWRGRRYALPISLIAGCLIGLYRGSVSQQVLSPHQKLVGYEVTVEGRLYEDVDIGKNDELVLRLENLKINSHALAGSAWVSTEAGADIKRGDIVTIRGKLAPGFGSFSSSVYRAELARVQRLQPGDVARQVRDEFADNVREGVPDPAASLGIGYLVGQRRALPPDLDQALRVAGLTHIVVASGYNLTILVRLARRLFSRISKYMAAFASFGMIVSFIAVTGLSPSMSRAGLVTGLSLLAWYYGRKFHPLILLSLAAAATLLIRPSYGWNDLGWQLSFAAFAGVMILAPIAQRYLFGDKKPSTIRQILGETIAAQLATWPILVMAFGQFSNVAVIANLLVLPLVPLAMLLTFIAGIAGSIGGAMAAILSAPATWILEYMVAAAKFLAGAPGAQTELNLPIWGAVLFYLALIGACFYMVRKTKFNIREANIVE